MKDATHLPGVILGMYGFNHIPIRRGLFRKTRDDRKKLKRLKHSYNSNMRGKRDIKGWNREYIIYSNSLSQQN